MMAGYDAYKLQEVDYSFLIMRGPIAVLLYKP